MGIKNNMGLMHEVIENMEYMVRVMDSQHRVIYMNQKMRSKFGHTLGTCCFDLLGGDHTCENCITSQAKQTGKPDQKDVEIDGKYYKLMSSPVSLEEDNNYSIELIHDITDQKRTELELLKHYEKLKEDIRFAKQIQYRALPLDDTYWNCLKINSLYVQSEDLGGDFFDIVQLDENRVFLYIADIAGHGVKSSLLTIFVRQVIRGIVKKENIGLKDILEELFKSYGDLHTNIENYFTFLCAIYDKSTGKITFANAGHNCLPIKINAGGKISEIQVKGIPVCSIFSETHHEEVEVKLEKGEKIIFYTDGISESYSRVLKNQFGSEGIMEVLEESNTNDNKLICGKIIQRAAAFAGVSPLDDMAVLIAEAV